MRVTLVGVYQIMSPINENQTDKTMEDHMEPALLWGV